MLGTGPANGFYLRRWKSAGPLCTLHPRWTIHIAYNVSTAETRLGARLLGQVRYRRAEHLEEGTLLDPRLMVFLAVAREGQLTEAARQINMSVSNVSQQISSLDADFGTQLFTRTNRGAKLSPAGEVLRKYAESIEADWRLAFRDVHRVAAGEHAVHIAASHTVMEVFLPRLLGAFRRRFPTVQVKLHALGLERTLTILSMVQWALSVPIAFLILGVLFWRLVLHKLPTNEMAISTWISLGTLGTGVMGLRQMPLLFGAVGHGMYGGAVLLALGALGLWNLVARHEPAVHRALCTSRAPLQPLVVGTHVPPRRLHRKNQLPLRRAEGPPPRGLRDRLLPSIGHILGTGGYQDNLEPPAGPSATDLCGRLKSLCRSSRSATTRRRSCCPLTAEASAPVGRRG